MEVNNCGITQKQLYDFLLQVDSMFPISLSQKQNLEEFADKLYQKALLCMEVVDNKIVACVAGYVDNVTDNRGYISIVATRTGYQGKGYASKLIRSFLAKAKNKGLSSVHLYAVSSNIVAINMYKRIGFDEWILKDEIRPDDMHLIYKFCK